VQKKKGAKKFATVFKIKQNWLCNCELKTWQKPSEMMKQLAIP